MSDDVMADCAWADPHRADPARAAPEGFNAVDWSRGFGRQVGPVFRRDADGRCVMGLRIEDRHTNGMLNAHGGLLMTLADLAWGNVVSMERSVFWVTVRLVCDFLSAAGSGDWIEAGGELIADADDLYVVQGRVWCQDRTLVSGTGVFKAMKPREPRLGEKAYQTADAAVGA
jgi:acyl-coenzyme A thioesterase PaaI-like protein